jgi:hypothetical protein
VGINIAGFGAVAITLTAFVLACGWRQKRKAKFAAEAAGFGEQAHQGS